MLRIFSPACSMLQRQGSSYLLQLPLCFSILHTMADTSVLCVFRFLSTTSVSTNELRVPSHSPLRRSLWMRRQSRNIINFTVKASSDDSSGFFDWDSSFPGSDAFHWVPEERITLFTSDGLVQIGGSMVPKSASSDKKLKASQKTKRDPRTDHTFPKRGLCLGALFNIAATNGLDMGRRLCFFGFCRSIEMLNDVVEDAVLEHGGEIVSSEKGSNGGLQEKLTMMVAVPFLWGVPPASDTLHLAVLYGGGIVDKIYRQWDFL